MKIFGIYNHFDFEFKRCKVLYFASSKGIGFTGHLSDFAPLLSAAVNAVFVSGNKEQYPEIFKKLDELNITRETIETLDTSKNLATHIWGMIKILDKYAPEIVHSQTNYQLLISAILQPFFKYKIIQTIHAFNNGNKGVKMACTKFYLTIMCKIFATKVIFQSKYVEDNFTALKSKSHRLPMGYKGPDLTQSKLLTQPLRIIYAAKFHSAKNHKWLIETLGTHLEANNWQLVLPGDGVQLNSIRALVRENGLYDRVHLPGWVNRDEIDSLYKAAHIAVVPSNSETLGHNIIEPLSYAIPVISFPVGIAPDLARETSAVTCIPFYERNALIVALESTLSSSVKYGQLSEEASIFFRAKLTWNIHVKNYINILNEL